MTAPGRRLLVVRHAPDEPFCAPGLVWPGQEAPLAALDRSLRAEVGLAAGAATWAGRFAYLPPCGAGPAAPITLYWIRADTAQATAAGVEARWIAFDGEAGAPLDALMRQHVLPLLQILHAADAGLDRR